MPDVRFAGHPNVLAEIGFFQNPAFGSASLVQKSESRGIHIE